MRFLVENANIDLGDLTQQKQIGNGGAGRVYAHPALPNQCIKIYHRPPDPVSAGIDHARAHEAKVRAMLANPPDLVLGPHGAVQMAWPRAIVIDSSGTFRGFVMPFIDFNSSHGVNQILTRSARRRFGIPDALIFRLTGAVNLAFLMDSLHKAGHYIIDAKPGNMRIYGQPDNRAGFVALLDCDGFCVSEKAGNRTFPATLATPDYAHPDGIPPSGGVELAWMNKHPREQDLWSLAVLIFQILNEMHPMQGVPVNFPDYPSTLNDLTKRHSEVYAYGVQPNPRVDPRPNSLHEWFSPDLRRLFDRTFSGNLTIPSAREWLSVLNRLRKPDHACPRNESHWKLGDHCGQCEFERHSNSVQLPRAQVAAPIGQRKVPHQAATRSVAQPSSMPARPAPQSNAPNPGPNPSQTNSPQVQIRNNKNIWPVLLMLGWGVVFAVIATNRPSIEKRTLSSPVGDSMGSTNQASSSVAHHDYGNGSNFIYTPSLGETKFNSAGGRIQEYLIHGKGDGLEISAAYPQTGVSSIDKELAALVVQKTTEKFKELRSQVEKYGKHSGLDCQDEGDECGLEYGLGYNVERWDDRVIAFSFEEYTYLGGGDAYPVVTTFNYYLPDGRRFGFLDVFKSQSVSYIKGLALEEYHRHAQGERNYWLDQGAGEVSGHMNNFILQPGELQIFMPQNYGDGPGYLDVRIPLAKLQGHFRETSVVSDLVRGGGSRYKPFLGESGDYLGATGKVSQGRCIGGYCSWARWLNVQLQPSAEDEQVLLVTLLGGSSEHRSADGGYAPYPGSEVGVNIVWNSEPHSVEINCSHTSPEVAGEKLPLNINEAIPGVLESAVSLYFQACHSDFESLDINSAISKYGYDVPFAEDEGMPGAVIGAGFDCAKAATEVEFAICASRDAAKPGSGHQERPNPEFFRELTESGSRYPEDKNELVAGPGEGHETYGASEIKIYRRTNPPKYPVQSVRRRQEGEVVLRVLIDERGHPIQIEVKKSSRHRLLDRAASDAVKNWIFNPGMQSGKPIKSWVLVPFEFRLGDY